ncbi:MAG: hypothetical protein ABDH37_00670 [Candidatus Hydrothermales bacterium]
MGNIKIVSAENDRDLELFIKTQSEIYKSLPLVGYVEPLKVLEMNHLNPRGHNPLFKKMFVRYFIALKNDKPVGRISAYKVFHKVFGIDEKITGFFGHFESIPDKEVASLLLESAQSFLKSLNCEKIIGPASFAYDGVYGVQIKGFEYLPMVMTPWNPEYYSDLIEECGYKKMIDFLGWFIPLYVIHPRLSKIVSVEDRLYRENGIKIRKANLKNFKEELKKVKDIYNSAWENNFGTVPLEEEDIEYIAENLKPLIVNDGALISEIKGEPVGVAIGIPNFLEAIRDFKGNLNPLNTVKLLWRLNKLPFSSGIPRLKSARLLILGVKKEYQEGVGVLMAAKILLKGYEFGYKYGEGSLTLENNYDINNLIRRLGGLPYKIYRVFYKEIS